MLGGAGVGLLPAACCMVHGAWRGTGGPWGEGFFCIVRSLAFWLHVRGVCGCKPGSCRETCCAAGYARRLQVLSGLPAVAVLTCVEEDGQLVGAIEGLVDVLHKQLKVGRHAKI